ncbi:hypothetical protein PUN28_011147 [Cardiocondyla obscurior]|uniref:Uncharacterized protein n=1 Tax=Cardiocondyla obscurior TaxID=286306 RepID=A0AAW2FQA1_9HYME
MQPSLPPTQTPTNTFVPTAGPRERRRKRDGRRRRRKKPPRVDLGDEYVRYGYVRKPRAPRCVLNRSRFAYCVQPGSERERRAPTLALGRVSGTAARSPCHAFSAGSAAGSRRSPRHPLCRQPLSPSLPARFGRAPSSSARSPSRRSRAPPGSSLRFVTLSLSPIGRSDSQLRRSPAVLTRPGARVKRKGETKKERERRRRTGEKPS